MSPKVEKGISWCPNNERFLIRTEEDKGYFLSDIYSLIIERDKFLYWDNWEGKVRDTQTKNASLVVPLQLLRWQDD